MITLDNVLRFIDLLLLGAFVAGVAVVALAFGTVLANLIAGGIGTDPTKTKIRTSASSATITK